MEPRNAFAFGASPSVQPRQRRPGAKQVGRESVPVGQATERQRLTRELHDSTSQLLVAAQLMAGRLKRTLSDQDALAIVDELQELVTEIQQEIRSISYLSQPPALEKLSFTEAVRRLVEGFGQRSGLIVSMHRTLARRGGGVALVGVQPEVARLLEIAGLTETLLTAPDVGKAIALLSENGDGPTAA